eukprot:s94_g14.t1
MLHSGVFPTLQHGLPELLSRRVAGGTADADGNQKPPGAGRRSQYRSAEVYGVPPRLRSAQRVDGRARSGGLLNWVPLESPAAPGDHQVSQGMSLAGVIFCPWEIHPARSEKSDRILKDVFWSSHARLDI